MSLRHSIDRCGRPFGKRPKFANIGEVRPKFSKVAQNFCMKTRQEKRKEEISSALRAEVRIWRIRF